MKLGPSIIGAVVGALVGVAIQVGMESVLGFEASWFAIVIGVLTGLGTRAMAGEGMQRTSFVRAGLAALIALSAIIGGSIASSKMMHRKSRSEYENAPSRIVSKTSPDSDDSDTIEEPENPADPTDTEVPEDESSEATESEDTTVDETAAEEAETDNAETATVEEADPTENTESEDDLDEGSEPLDEDVPDATAGTEPGNTSLPSTANGSNNSQLPPNAVAPAELPMSPWHFAFVAIGTLVAYELSRGGSKH